MNPERLKQLRQSWTGRRGQATVHALIDAVEAAEAFCEYSACGTVDACYKGDPCRYCRAVELFEAAKARI